ncbi:MAG: FHA domain-containing protein [Gammaproteobacteria bacterium]
MELIFEIIDPTGRRHTCQKLSGERLSIGRAFDNDVILTDPTVDPHHALIERDEKGEWILRDLDSLNGVYDGHKNRVHGSAGLVPGSEYRLGKTCIHIYTPEYKVPAASRIGGAVQAMDLLGNPLIVMAAVLLTFSVYALRQWQNMFGAFEWQDIVNISLVIFGSALAITIFWAVIGRILRHQANFRKQWTIVLIFMVGQYLLSILYDLVLFNTLDYMLSMAVMILFECVLVAILLWFNLYLATNQSASQRLKTAVAVSLVLMVLSVYSEFVFRPEFSATPDYVRVLKPPLYLFAGTVTEEEFIADAADVFARLESD